jgi:hypothetical protein
MTIVQTLRNHSLSLEKARRFSENKFVIEEWIGGELGGICPEAKFLDGYVENKKKYRKIIPCGKEWCPVCGQKGSLLHRQRYGRGLDKILGADVLGYFAITFPMEVRHEFINRNMLSSFMRDVNEILKTYRWYVGAVSHWHWGGDEHKGVWHPHLNILVNQNIKGIPYRDLDKIKKDIWEWVCMNIREVKTVVVSYHYTNKLGHKMQWWRYIVRPTMLLLGDELYSLNLMNKLYNFHNTRWYGKWEKRVELNKAIKILNDETIVWVYVGRFEGSQLTELLESHYIGYGIFELNDTG